MILNLFCWYDDDIIEDEQWRAMKYRIILSIKQRH